MSLIGVDVGSSSLKACAYDEAGKFIFGTSREAKPLHPSPGLWEQAPKNVWDAACDALCELAGCDGLKLDVPKALAISVSGRENFPMLADGTALMNNIMGADIRGEELERSENEPIVPEAWELNCGHLKERMDPVFRFLWCKKNYPEIIARAQLYPDWHGFLTYMLCGQNVSDPSLVGRWACYDINRDCWDKALQRKFGMPDKLLPQVLHAGEPIARISSDVAVKTGLPKELLIVTGGHDLNCCALGAGANDIDTACLISGSYENMLIPTLCAPSVSILKSGLSITPHFGKMKRSVYAICPTGNAVMNWVRGVTKTDIAEVEAELKNRREPSSVMAMPYLSGAMLHWKNGRKLRGTILGMTLATTPIDIAQAMMESIAFDDARTIELLAKEGIKPSKIRATGGGTRSEWWTQLKCDLMGMPVEISGVNEPGTFGAAMLAAVGAGIIETVEKTAEISPVATKAYLPDMNRRELYRERMCEYSQAVEKTLEIW